MTNSDVVAEARALLAIYDASYSVGVHVGATGLRSVVFTITADAPAAQYMAALRALADECEALQKQLAARGAPYQRARITSGYSQWLAVQCDMRGRRSLDGESVFIVALTAEKDAAIVKTEIGGSFITVPLRYLEILEGTD